MRRPAVISTTRASLISLVFPVAGTISATTNLGIAWADPSDHTVPLSRVHGFDFHDGVGYTSINFVCFASQTLLPTTSISFYMVDSSGSDLYLIGLSGSNSDGAVSFDGISLSIAAGAAVGNGVRGQVTISGTYSVVIPSPVMFFGSMSVN